MVIITLAGLLGVTILFLISAILHITKIQHELEMLGKEQHTQNMDIIKLMKDDQVVKEMLFQHIEVLKYLVEQDPKLKAHKALFSTVIGEA